MAERKTISIFGATGSIGQSTVDIVLAHPDRFKVAVVTANSNAKKLAEIAMKLNAQEAVIADNAHYAELKKLLESSNVQVTAGHNALLEAAARPVDFVMAGIVGMAGLAPLAQSIKAAPVVAIANKEPLVAAGRNIMALAQKCDTILLPTDSEHNAIYQVLEERNRGSVESLILTASGGPFRNMALQDMKSVTPAQAVAHPNWSMGAKISVDSATMMNKALEIIEAHHLFAMPAAQIEVLIHPQSIIHSMVSYKDGSVLAQLGAPDMRTPIAYCLGWPERIETSGNRLDVLAMKELTFEAVNDERFPAVGLAYEALRAGQAHCLAFNTANEVAVKAFLDGKIGFTDIVEINSLMMARAETQNFSAIDDIIRYDRLVREQTAAYIGSSF